MTEAGAGATPRDIVICCCRDEEDIIEAFIAFYLDQGFDRVCLVDNGSVDRTPELIARHLGTGKVLLHSDPRPRYDFHLMEHYQHYADEADRWVFFLDTDEFVKVPGGIKSYAAQLPPEVNVLELPVVDMLPALPVGARHPLTSTRRGKRWHDWPKVVWKRGPVRKIWCGRLRIDLEPYQARRDPSLFIRHYDVHSSRQLRRKLENRLALLDSLSDTDPDLDELSIFSRRDTRLYREETVQLLNGDLDRYVRQCAATAAVEDREMLDWYLGRWPV